jgi:hypothetical protein
MLAALTQNANAVRRAPLLFGDWGTAQTISQIRRLVEQGKRSIAVNRLAIAIVWNTPNFSTLEKARAIFNWVQANTRFIPMITGVQTLRSATEILRVRGGDCTNLNGILIPSLLETIGIPARLVTIAGDADDRGEFTHVYAEALIDGEWIPMDVARPGAIFGLAPEVIYRKKIWNIDPSLAGEAKKLAGYLGACCRKGMGDFSTDVAALTSGGANIINSLRAAPQNITGYSSPNASVGAGQLQAQAYGYTGPSLLGIPSWVWLLVVAGGIVAVAGGRRR